MKRWVALLFYFILASFIGVTVKLIGKSIPFMSINFFRLFFAFLVLVIICPILDKKTFKVSRKDIALYTLIGFLFALTALLHTTSYLFAPISNVVFLSSTSFIVTLILSYVFLKECPKKATIFAGFLALVGIYIINPFQGMYVLGNILALISAITCSILYTLMRYTDKKHTIGNILWIIFFASLFSLPPAMAQGFGSFSPNIIWLILLGSVSTGFAYLFFTYALQKMKVTLVSVTSLIFITLLSIFFGIIFIGESISFNVVIGGFVVIVSGIIIETKTNLIKV